MFNIGHLRIPAVTFPYMTPDNNATLASYLTQNFVPSQNCIKTRSEELSSIVESTYYYDIFGCKKDDVIKDAERVYCPKEPSKIRDFFKRLKSEIWGKDS